MPVSACTGGANFNCIDTSIRSYSNATAKLYTKLAGTPFSIDVIALNASGGQESNYAVSGGTTKTVTVELVDGSGTTACASRAAITPTVSQTLAFAASNSGRKSTASMTVTKAYADLRCRVTTNQVPSIVGCSSDNFSVRPGVVTLMTTALAAAPSVTALPVFKAGSTFTIGATTTSSATDAYTGILMLDSTKLGAQLPSNNITQQQIGGTVGSLTVNPPVQANTSPLQSHNAIWNETGYLYAFPGAFRDDSFTSVDQVAGDCVSTTTNDANLSDIFDANNKIGCSIGNKTSVSFGRFIPDHFAITQGTVTPSCSTFTYFGQNGFSTDFTLTAQDLSNNKTQNYIGAFAKLSLAYWSDFNFTATGLPAGSILATSATLPTGNWSNGVATVTAKHQISRPTDVIGEINVVIQAKPIDSDGVTMTSANVTSDTPMRYGRLFLQNNYGSELQNLPISLTSQYWNGTNWATNVADNCTMLDAPSGSGLSINLANGGTTTVTLNNPIAFGNTSLSLIAPGATHTGYVDMIINSPPWLDFDWNGTGDTDPSARATFGIYKGNSKIIYLYEIY
jgi:MSHA biogenesis protein MshQ